MTNEEKLERIPLFCRKAFEELSEDRQEMIKSLTKLSKRLASITKEESDQDPTGATMSLFAIMSKAKMNYISFIDDMINNPDKAAQLMRDELSKV